MLLLAGALALGLTLVALSDRLLYGRLFAVALLGVAAILAWQARTVTLHPRNMPERQLGLSMLAMVVSGAIRMVWTLACQGPVRADLIAARRVAERLRRKRSNRCADEALYRFRRLGRNQCQVAMAAA